jgi:hypothetical protein
LGAKNGWLGPEKVRTFLGNAHDNREKVRTFFENSHDNREDVRTFSEKVRTFLKNSHDNREDVRTFLENAHDNWESVRAFLENSHDNWEKVRTAGDRGCGFRAKAAMGSEFWRTGAGVVVKRAGVGSGRLKIKGQCEERWGAAFRK